MKRHILPLILTGLTLSPLLMVSVPPLVDYPNQLAHMWILRHGQEIPALAANYVVHWRLVPYLAMDLIVPPLTAIVPIEAAGRVFIALTLLGLVLGTAALHRALHGRVGPWPFASLLFLYNAVLFWGFMNCLFGIAMFLLVFAGWVATAGWRLAPRLALFAAAACLLLLLHLFAFCLYGLAVASYELGLRLEQRGGAFRRLLSYAAVGLQFVPGLVLWRLSLANAGATYTSYGDFSSKLYAAIAPTAFGFPPAGLDIAIWLFAALFLGCALLGGWLRLAPRMRLPLLAMVLAAVAMPNWLSGSWAADIRLPVVLPFLVIAATRIDAPGRGRLVGGFAAAAILLLALRVWAVSAAWLDGDRRIAEFRAADAAMAPGSRIFTVMDSLPGVALPALPAFLGMRQPFSAAHLQAFAVIDRAAFIPDMFYGWITVDPAPRNRGAYQDGAGVVAPELLERSADPATARTLAIAPNELGQLPYWLDWPKKFDYVLWLDEGQAPKAIPRQLMPVGAGSFFHLYRIERP